MAFQDFLKDIIIIAELFREKAQFDWRGVAPIKLIHNSLFKMHLPNDILGVIFDYIPGSLAALRLVCRQFIEETFRPAFVEEYLNMMRYLRLSFHTNYIILDFAPDHSIKLCIFQRGSEVYSRTLDVKFVEYGKYTIIGFFKFIINYDEVIEITFGDLRQRSAKYMAELIKNVANPDPNSDEVACYPADDYTENVESGWLLIYQYKSLRVNYRLDLDIDWTHSSIFIKTPEMRAVYDYYYDAQYLQFKINRVIFIVRNSVLWMYIPPCHIGGLPEKSEYFPCAYFEAFIRDEQKFQKLNPYYK